MPYIGAEPDKGNFADLNGGKLILDADADTSITADTDDQIDIEIAGSDELKITATMIAPASADGSALGGTSNEWSDLYLADSSVIYFGADQDITLTHAADTGLTTNGTFQATTITATTAVVPDASDGAALGTTSLEWSDLYIADGGVIYFGDDQDVTVTHVADTAI